MWLPRSAAAVCVAGLLLTVPVVDLAHADTPHPVTGDDHAVSLGAAAGTVAPAAADAPAPAPTEPAQVVKEVTVGAGALIGVTLDDGTAATSVRVRVQDDGGAWGEWTSLDVDGGPDRGSAEARRAARAVPAEAATDPLWIGQGDDDRRVQVQLPSADAARAAVAVVDPGTSRADSGVTRTGPAASASAATSAVPRIHPRSDWGADESLRTCSPSYSATVRAGILHHTAGTNDYSAADVPAILRGIYRYHTQTHGWCDIGYSFLVDRFGGLWEGRAGGEDRAVVGAHTGGFNEDTFAVSMIGDYQDVSPGDATMESVAQLMAWKLGGNYRDPQGTVTLTSAGGGTARYAAGTRVTLPTIFGHRDVGSTECPGDAGYAELPGLRRRVTQLIGSPSGVLYDAWRARGGAAGALGEPSATEGATAGGAGRYTPFGGGSLYWTSATGAHAVAGAIRSDWAALGWERSVLGYPLTDETSTPDGAGRYNHFSGGSVYWTPSTGAHEVTGSIRDRWASLGWEGSVLGYPTTDESAVPDRIGRYNHFSRGSVYWTPGTGAHEVHGAIRGEWASLGWERSDLGYPTTDEGRTPDGVGRYNHFSGGSVYWTPSTGAHELTGAVRDRWASLGWERSALGYPTGDPVATATGRTQQFQGGTITETGALGAAAVARVHLAG